MYTYITNKLKEYCKMVSVSIESALSRYKILVCVADYTNIWLAFLVPCLNTVSKPVICCFKHIITSYELDMNRIFCTFWNCHECVVASPFSCLGLMLDSCTYMYTQKTETKGNWDDFALFLCKHKSHWHRWQCKIWDPNLFSFRKYRLYSTFHGGFFLLCCTFCDYQS